MRAPLSLAVVCLLGGCASVGTAPFVLDGHETRMNDAGYRDVVAARAAQSFPIQQQTTVPPRLQPLAMDLATILSRAEDRNCSSHKLRSIVPDTASTSEVWTVDACGITRQYRVQLRPCNNMLKNPLVVISREPSDGHYLAGKDPLDSSFLVACPDKG